jgi:RNA polymerase sigma-70 factor (ECF subfamily)
MGAGHEGWMLLVETAEETPSSAIMPAPSVSDPRFEAAYQDHFDFVWCSLRRLGVPPSSVDDAVQDVFLVVLRRLREFEGRASIKTWLYRIALRVARDYRRKLRRKGGLEPLTESLVDATQPGPLEDVARNQAVRMLDALLDQLDDDKREVFFLAEIEQLPAPEISALLEIKLNTVYSRLRAARRDFERNLARLSARVKGER